MRVTTRKLAKLLSEELERDYWGDIDPFLFKMVAQGIDTEDDNAEDAKALKHVLDRVVEKIK